MSVLVEARGVARHYPAPGGLTLRALDGVDLSIARGATIGLVGESGCGKTTLGRTLVGLQTPTRGEIYFDGVPTSNPDRSQLKTLRRQRQIVFQDPSGALNPRMRVGDTVAEHLIVQGWSRQDARRRVSEAFDQCGLDTALASRYPHEISGGQRQRAVIARAISADPAFIVADEPVTALDVSTRAQIMNLLRDIQQARGLTMLFISHDLSVVAHMCRQVAVMYLGRIVEMAPRETLFRAPLHPYTSALMAAIPIPDPAYERRRKRIALKGETPDPSNIPKGCRFNSRCPRAIDICGEVDPALVEMYAGHSVACHNPLEPPGAAQSRTIQNQS